ncbi:hypothetical protein [Sphingobacterium daejeonense]|uniref:hypothetical protein n=1 Tax=Sphingobacterium daejeonense TaxID=371142 RepID=UPI0010C2E9BA|nr:hypothetical protein [Sphingobacterium daejeonense]VTP89090.1 Uncharacterised protein [Sphingobacterium daejeonense]
MKRLEITPLKVERKLTMAMTEEEKKYKGIIWTLSIIIPLAVAALFGINLPKMGYDVEPLSFFTSHLCHDQWFDSSLFSYCSLSY